MVCGIRRRLWSSLERSTGITSELAAAKLDCRLTDSKAKELAQLVTDSRTFMSQIAKAKTAKLGEFT